MSERVGFIGLGIMGRPMAKNLLKAGYELTVWNRSRPGIDDLVAAGAAAGSGPRDVAERSDIVITIVTDSPDVQQVALGPDGITEAARPGLVMIDMSTISPEVTRLIAARLADLIILSDNPLTVEPNAIKDLEVMMTMVGGRVVHCASGYEASCPGW